MIAIVPGTGASAFPAVAALRRSQRCRRSISKGAAEAKSVAFRRPQELHLRRPMRAVARLRPVIPTKPNSRALAPGHGGSKTSSALRLITASAVNTRTHTACGFDSGAP